MIKHLLILCLITLACNSWAANGEDYRLGTGDKIEILVYDEPDLTIETIISDNGTINYPFVGTIQVAGKSIKQVESAITLALMDGYLASPSVTINIREYRQFFIHGEVKKPGGYPYQPGLTVDQAIALAGGFSERASEENIFISSSAKSSSPRNKVSVNESIKPGDTIVVKQSYF